MTEEFWTERLPVIGAELDLRLHTSDERYRGIESRLERDHLTHDAGARVYVMGRPETPGPGYLNQAAGNAQAWYYPADGVLVLWECYLFDHLRTSTQPGEDARHVATWRAFEAEMIRRFRPSVVVCPAWEPVYQEADWQAFLVSEGYTIGARRLAVKRLSGEGEVTPDLACLSADRAAKWESQQLDALGQGAP